MYIARQQYKESLVGYLLYMWQVEDLLRAAELDDEKIEELILSRYQLPEEQLQEVRQWYLELRDMMRLEGKQKEGHLEINRVQLMALEDLHRELLRDDKDVIYTSLHYQVLPALIELKNKNPKGGEMSEVELALNALYGYTTLKLSGKEVNPETQKSIQQLGNFLSMLSHRYKERWEKKGEE